AQHRIRDLAVLVVRVELHAEPAGGVVIDGHRPVTAGGPTAADRQHRVRLVILVNAWLLGVLQRDVTGTPGHALELDWGWRRAVLPVMDRADTRRGLVPAMSDLAVPDVHDVI